MATGTSCSSRRNTNVIRPMAPLASLDAGPPSDAAGAGPGGIPLWAPAVAYLLSQTFSRW